MGKIITPKQSSILTHLARYKYLNRKQIFRLGVEKYSGNLTNTIMPLVDTKFVGLIDAQNYDLGHVYYLKSKGAKIIAEHLQVDTDDIQFVKSEPTITSQTLYHRNYAIDCQIEVDIWCKRRLFTLPFYHREIETLKGGSRYHLERKTRLKLFDKILEPDAIFLLDTPEGNKLYCFELENKTFKKKTVHKIEKHLNFINHKVASIAYDHPKGSRSLFVYQDYSLMQSVMRHVSENIGDTKKWVLFKHLDDVVPDIKLRGGRFHLAQEFDYFENWRTCNDEIVSML